MNKTVFPLVMAVLTACPVLFSCTEKEQEVPVENKIYEYRFELAGDDTRAYLNDDGVFWELNDHVGLFTPTESLKAAVNTDASPKTIDVQSSTPLAVGTKVYAYYPYVEENTSVSASKVLFPAEQSGGSISAMPLAGIPAEVVTEGEYNGVIRFLNLGSVIDFRVFSLTHSNETVESISLKADAGNLAGTATIDLTGVSWNETDETATIPALAWADGAGSSTVTLTQSAPVAADKDAAIADGNLYMVVAPGTYSGTITVTTNAARYTFPITNKELVLNGLKRFNMNLDNATEREDRFVTINLEEATELVAGEKYVLVSNGVALVRDGGNASAAAFDATAETVAVPVDLQENFEWTLEKKSGSITRGNEYVFTQEGGYFFGIAMNTSQQTYTYTVEVNNGRNVSTNISIQDHNISLANDLIYYAGNSSNYYVFYNTASGIWDNEKVGNTASPAATSSTALYKVKDMRAEQNPQFSAATAEYDLYSKTWTVALPTLSGAQGAVTYTSSDETVAQVDNTGAVTIMTTAKSGDTATITAKAAGNDAYKPSGEVSYTISIVNNNPNVSRYNKVTSVGDLEVGAKYLIVYEGTTTTDNTPKVFNPVLNSDGTQFAKATSSAVNVTLSSGVIESSDVADYEFTLEDGYYLKADKAAKYLYPGTSGSGYNTSSVLLAESSASHALAITFDSGIAQILCNERYVVWSTNSHYFSSNADVSGQYSTGICLYKLDDGRQAQEISFSAADAEYDLGTKTWTKAFPTLTGTPQGDVTYSSSDETVATVANDGTVTPLKKGTATITAKAAGNATYKPASASYELNVVNSNVPTYVKADEVESGKVYLIVSNGNVLVNNNGSAAVEAVTVSGGQIKYDAPDVALWTATVSSGSITFANGTRTLGRSNSNISLSASASFSYDSEHEYLTTKSSSTSTNTYYLYCTTSFRYSQNSAQNAALYVLDDGRQAQEIAFGAADAEYDLGTGAWTKVTPALTGAKTTVTYASSDETVATVANDGTVTPLKVGTTTITATASADAQYKKATASYTLSVVNSAVVEKTYNRVSSISAGTYLIMGRETSSGRAGTYVCVFPPSEDNKCDHIKVSDNQDLATLTTTSNEYGAYEVELIASGSNWLVKVKSSGQYMYYASSKISFTDDASVAAQQITSNGGYPACIKNTNNDQFYHSGSNTCFMYSNNKNANNLRFFKLSE